MREQNKMKKLFLVSLLGLVVGMSVGLGNAIRAVAYIVFFREPIPCKIYLEKKQYFDEELVEKGLLFSRDHFFRQKFKFLARQSGLQGVQGSGESRGSS